MSKQGGRGLRGKFKWERLFGILFWLIIWQAAAMILDKKVLLVTPLQAAKRLWELIFEKNFLRTVTNSFLRIGAGFMLGLFGGIGAAAFAYRFKAAKVLIQPIMTAVKSIPVASFVILALLWIKSSGLSTFVTFLIVLPVMYSAVYEGLQSAPVQLKEAAEVFGIKGLRRVRFLYLPSIMPFLVSAISTGAGLAFKSGTAAEVIGQPDFTLGDMLFRAKIYLETADLFAWTAVIIILGRIFEGIVMGALKRIYKLSQKVR
ncbi:MAG: ABC transporter permease subunit [Oscillospiraceae bacterium]|nr:ABC transporter permease subunit [Oscillospiraceae bacterium]